MALLLSTGNWRPEGWRDAFQRAAPHLMVYVHDVDAYEPAAIRYAATWKPPAGLLAGLPNLEVIFNLGAGVDALMADHTRPDIAIVRLVDDDLTWRMGEWVTLQVLTHHRRALMYLEQQRRHQWRDVRPQPIARQVRVGFMGYGVLARHAAGLLQAIGYSVHAWTRHDRAADVPITAGQDRLAGFLAATDVLVCLLPLTEETRGLLDHRLVDGLARDGALGRPVLINAGRGGLQNAADIRAALEDGRLSGASLDVFETEPLPADDPLWDAPNLVITPHNSAISDPDAVAAYVTRQIRRYEDGAGLENIVEPGRGY